MEPYQSPDSTMNNDTSEDLPLPQPTQQQPRLHNQERRVSSSSNRFLPTPSLGGSSGTAPRLLLKATGSGSFQSTPVGVETDRSSSTSPRKLPRLIFTGVSSVNAANSSTDSRHARNSGMGSLVQSTSGGDSGHVTNEPPKTPKLIFKGGLPTMLPRGLEVTPVSVRRSDSGVEGGEGQDQRRAPRMKINRGFSSSNNLSGPSFQSSLIEDADPSRNIPIRKPPKLVFTGLQSKMPSTSADARYSVIETSSPGDMIDNSGAASAEVRRAPKMKITTRLPQLSTPSCNVESTSFKSTLVSNEEDSANDVPVRMPKSLSIESRRNSLQSSQFQSYSTPAENERTGEHPSEPRDSLQKISSLVDVIDNTPASLPRPRFLQSGVRHFLNNNPRGPPPLLSPLRIKKPILPKQIPGVKMKKLVKPGSSSEANLVEDLRLKDCSGLQKTPQSTLIVSPSSSAQPGIKLHIRRGVEAPVDNYDNVVSEQDLTVSKPISLASECNQISTIADNSSLQEEHDTHNETSNAISTEEVPQKAKAIENNTVKIKGKRPMLDSPSAAAESKKVSGRKQKRLAVSQQAESETEQIKLAEETMKMDFEDDIQKVALDSEGRLEASEEIRDDKLTSNNDGDGNARRTQRKRKPTKHYMTDMVVPRIKMRKRKEANEEEVENSNSPIEITEDIKPEPIVADTPPDTTQISPSRGRGRGRGTGRGRGRPRGSGLKAKVDRLSTPTKVEPEEPVVESMIETPKSEPPDSEPEIEAPGPDSSSPDVDIDLPLEGDAEVNDSLSPDILLTPTKSRARGRGRGSRARGSRGARGARRSLKTEKKKSPKLPVIKEPPPVQVFEEETRMSADIKTSSDKPTPVSSAACTPLLSIQDEESRASNISSTSASTSTTKAKKFSKDFLDERKPVTADTIYEYQWPQDDSKADYYFLQEQITEFLGMKSFRRKYPELKRRVVEMEERDFLRQQKIVSETQCDLGLTAVKSTDVLDILFNDFPEKYERYNRVIQERREKDLAKLKVATTPGPLPSTRDRSVEFIGRIRNACANWNSAFNKERKEDRSCSFDLQTGTLNYPKGKMNVLPKEATKVGNFPVSVLPGQYCDNFKSYSSTELKYMPLNTVLYGPILENAVDSDESDSESDSSSSSDDSSSSSSDEECSDVRKLENGIDESTNDGMISFSEGNERESQGVCRTCNGDAFKNKDGRSEVLIHCAKCDVANHPTCLDLSLDMVPFIRKYDWQCNDCKNCIECNDSADEDKMLFCDCCDRGYHIYCVGLRKVPNGRWHCGACSLCHSCGSTVPAQDDRMAEWHHEFKKGEKGFKYFLHSLCVSCHKVYKKGQYCPSCLKCHLKLDDKNLLECRNCEKWVHKNCVKRPLQTMFGFMCDTCNTTFKARTKLPSQRN